MGMCGLGTFERISLILVSVCFSSSVGWGGMLAADANCEYVWNSVSVCLLVSMRDVMLVCDLYGPDFLAIELVAGAVASLCLLSSTFCMKK